MISNTSSVPVSTTGERPTMSHEDFARACFAHILAERRDRPPLLWSLDDLLPLDLIPMDLTEAAIKQTVEAGRIVDFIAYGIRRPKALTIPLRASYDKYDYRRIAEASYWGDTPEYRGRWSFLTPFIEALPFESIGRTMIMFSDVRGRGVMHFDHDKATLLHEFIWLKPTNKKRFLLRYGGRDHYVTSRSCWFDSRHIHQTDGGPELEISMRVDGVFTPEFRQQIAARCADILELDRVPYVTPPDLAYPHQNPTDWDRLFTPRHYAHYFRTLAKEFVRKRGFPQMMPPESPAAKPEASRP